MYLREVGTSCICFQVTLSEQILPAFGAWSQLLATEITYRSTFADNNLIVASQAQGKRDPASLIPRSLHILTLLCAGILVHILHICYLRTPCRLFRPTRSCLITSTLRPDSPVGVPQHAAIRTMSENPLKRKYSSEDADMDIDSVPQANGNDTTNGAGDNRGSTEPRRLTPSFLHTDPRPDDFAHAGLRRGIALALDHVGFGSADAIAVESFALATEECTTPPIRQRNCTGFANALIHYRPPILHRVPQATILRRTQRAAQSRRL